MDAVFVSSLTLYVSFFWAYYRKHKRPRRKHQRRGYYSASYESLVKAPAHEYLVERERLHKIQLRAVTASYGIGPQLHCFLVYSLEDQSNRMLLFSFLCFLASPSLRTQ